VLKFRRSGSSSARVSSDTLLPSQATNAWAVGGLHRWCTHLVLLGWDGTGHGHRRRCTSTQDGQNLLKILPTEATTHETTVTNRSATNRTKGSRVRKIRTVQNAKPDHPVFQEAAVAPDRQHKLEALKSGSSANQSGGSQGQTRPRNETSADGEAKPNAEKNPVEVIVEQNKVLGGAKAETKTEAETSSRQPQNQIVRFPKPDHPVSTASARWNRRGLPHPG
jgi:hypothetical protein